MTASDIDDPDVPDPDLDAWADWEQWCETNGAIPADGIEPSDQDALVHADRILGRLRRLARAEASDVYVRDQEVARIDVWYETRRAVRDETRTFLEAVLARFHAGLLTEDASRKTVSLPAGVLKARQQPDSWTVDEPVFVAWATVQAPDLLRRPKPSPWQVDRRAMKEALTVRDGVAVDASTGEVVPGVTVEEGAVNFNVEVSSE